MTAKERLALFDDYTNYPRFKYGPDYWVCPVCDRETCVVYVAPGKREDIPSINKIHHNFDCPQNPENKK